MGRLDGRVALITASGRNIGRAAALRFADEGADIVVNARANRAEAEAVAEEVRARGRRSVAVIADVSDRSQVDSMVATALAEFGRIDILLAAAAIRPHKPFLELTEGEWEAVRGTILDGGLQCAQAVLPSMVEHGRGSILFFVGDGAWAGSAERAHVSAAKMGLVGLCRGLASEFAPHGVRVNIISPGRIDTSRDATWYPTDRTETTGIPMGRLGTTDDIASACAFLVSDEASYISGQAIHVNGGSAFF